MKPLLALILGALLLSACAALAPTPSPTALPSPTRAPAAPSAAPSILTRVPRSPVPGAPTPAPITVKEVTQTTQADGTIRTTGRVTAEGDTLGLGQIELAYPDQMFLNETATIVLRISPAQQLVSLTPVPAPAKTPDLPSFVYKFSGNIQLYPVMIAQLRALQFKIDKPEPLRRVIESPHATIEWRWLASPLAVGRQDLSIELAIPTLINGVPSELSTNVLQDLTLSIQVQPPAPPTPTPTPPLLTRLGDSIIANAGAIAVALIGLIGTLVGILVKLRADQREAKKSR